MFPSTLHHLRRVGQSLALAASLAALVPSPASATTVTHPYPIGIRLGPNSRTLSFYNLHALTTDGAHQLNAVNELVKTKATDRSLMTNSLRFIPASIKLAKANHIKDIIFNDEGLPCATLIADEAAAYRQVHAAGLTMSFAPQGSVMVKICGVSAFVRNTDALYFQTEWNQGSPTYGADTHAVIAAIHRLRPGLPVVVQIDVNLRSNRQITAAAVLAQIRSVQDGGPNQATKIDVFMPGVGVDPGRLAVFEQVITALRPARTIQ